MSPHFAAAWPAIARSARAAAAAMPIVFPTDPTAPLRLIALPPDLSVWRLLGRHGKRDRKRRAIGAPSVVQAGLAHNRGIVRRDQVVLRGRFPRRAPFLD